MFAARALSKSFNVVLLEAMRRFGGRICTLHKKAFPQPIEGGAEFIHGKAVETKKLLKAAGLTYTKVGGKFYRKSKYTFVSDNGVEGWDELLKQMGALEQDMTLHNFLLRYFPDDQFQTLRTEAQTFAEGFDLADPERVSVKTLFNEWSHQSADHRVDEGYISLIKFLVNDCKKRGCQLINGAIVSEIKWQNQEVQITTLDNQIFKGHKCLVTVPLGVLQEKEGLGLSIQPGIPEYMEAASKIGYGKVIKIVLSFNKRFWKKDAGFFLSQEVFSAWWTQLPSEVPILTGWAGGPKAEELSAQSSSVILEKAIESLAGLFMMDEMTLKESLEGWRVFNWQKDKSILGGYSYATLETEDALKILNTPVSETLYFAGEGMYSGDHPGTVEAAILSVKSVADHLLNR